MHDATSEPAAIRRLTELIATQVIWAALVLADAANWAAAFVPGAAREGAHAAAAEHATVAEAVEAGRSRARDVLEAGLGGYADVLQVSDPVRDGGSIVVEIHGGLPLFFGGPGQDAPVRLPLD